MTSNLPSREYNQMLCTWVNCFMKFAHLHVIPLVVPYFQLRMNVLMRPLRMNISDSFVKTFSPVQRQLISFFFFLFCSSFFNWLSIAISYLSLHMRGIRSFFLRRGIQRLIILKYVCKLRVVKMSDEKIKSFS